jgi:hypothetical protein
VNTPLLVKDSDLEHTEAEKAEDDDEHPADALHPDLVVIEGTPEGRGAGTEQDKNERESRNEEQGVEQRSAAPSADFRKRHPGDEPDIRWHQGEHTGRQKTEEAGDESHHETQRGWLGHRGPSSRWRHSRHTP